MCDLGLRFVLKAPVTCPQKFNQTNHVSTTLVIQWFYYWNKAVFPDADDWQPIGDPCDSIYKPYA